MRSKITSRLFRDIPVSPKVIEIFDTGIKGFLLRVEPTGTMTYYLAYTNERGRRRRYKIGRHGHITVAQARDLAEKAAAKVVSGIDIQLERQTERESGATEQSHTLAGFIQAQYVLTR